MPPKRSTRSPSRSTSTSRKTAARKASPSPSPARKATPARSKSPARGRKAAATPAAVLNASPEKSTPPARRTRSKSRSTVVVPATAPPAPGRASTRRAVAETPIRTGEDFAASSSRILKSLRSRRPQVSEEVDYPKYNSSPYQSPAKPLPIAKQWLNKLPKVKLPSLRSTIDTVKANFVKHWHFYIIFLTLILMTWGYIANAILIQKKLSVFGETLSEFYEEHRGKIQALYDSLPARVAEQNAPAPPHEPEHVKPPAGKIPKPSA